MASESARELTFPRSTQVSRVRAGNVIAENNDTRPNETSLSRRENSYNTLTQQPRGCKRRDARKPNREASLARKSGVRWSYWRRCRQDLKNSNIDQENNEN